MPEISPRDQVYRFGDYVLYAQGPLLLRGNERVPMTPRVVNVLLVLVENAGQVVTKETLMSRVWSDSFVEEGNLNRTISRLRKAIGDTPDGKRFVETVTRVGYRFVAEVETGPVGFQQTTEDLPDATRGAKSTRRLKWPVVGGAIVLIGLGSLAGAIFLQRDVQVS